MLNLFHCAIGIGERALAFQTRTGVVINVGQNGDSRRIGEPHLLQEKGNVKKGSSAGASGYGEDDVDARVLIETNIRQKFVSRLGNGCVCGDVVQELLDRALEPGKCLKRARRPMLRTPPAPSATCVP